MANILLVDDEETVRELLKRGLELDRHNVELGQNGANGLDILREKNGEFDLLISDIRMPELDGIALAQAAKQAFPLLPILLMTGYAEQRERTKELEQVVEDVLTKPFSLGELRSTVTRILG